MVLCGLIVLVYLLTGLTYFPVYNLHSSSTQLTTQEIDRGYKTCTNLNLERVKYLFYPLGTKQLALGVETYGELFRNTKSTKWLRSKIRQRE